jgi:site-specific DNA-methyltransferase (adenine-specific)
MSKPTDEWGTPQALVDLLNEEFSFTIDVCATYENAKVRRFFIEHLPCKPDVDDGHAIRHCVSENGLTQSWKDEVFWCNPPYSSEVIDQWIEKASTHARGRGRGVSLVRADTSTRWWRTRIAEDAKEIRFTPRIHFVGAENSYNFPTALVVWDGRAGRGGPRYSYMNLPPEALGQKGRKGKRRSNESLTLDALAAAQGVKPMKDFAALQIGSPLTDADIDELRHGCES